jgi:hypothetical protein
VLDDRVSGAPAATADPSATHPHGQPAVASTEVLAGLAGDTRKLLLLIGAIVGPAAFATALAYYFGWRRERAFAGYFGVDPSVLGFSTSDYVLRSLDALFVPAAVVLLVSFATLSVLALVGDRIPHLKAGPVAGMLGVAAIAIGVALGAGHPVSSDYVYLQALGPGTGAVLVSYALMSRRGRAGAAVAGMVYVATAVGLVSVFWATSEFADSRGRAQAERLAANITRNPTATVFSRESLNIDPTAQGSGATGACPVLHVTLSRAGAFPYRYDGFTLLIRSDGKYFLTPTPTDGVWNPRFDSVFVLPDNTKIRVDLTRGRTYPAHEPEGIAQGSSLPFTC